MAQAQAPTPPTLEVLAWRPGDREPDTYFLARRGHDGQPQFAGAVQLGLGTGQHQRLRTLARERELGAPHRRRVRPVGPGVALIVSGYGPAGQPLRDAIIREIVLRHD